MNGGRFNMGRSKGGFAQFGHLLSDNKELITTPVVLNADTDLYVRIFPTTGTATVYVNTDGGTTGGFTIEGMEAIIVRQGEYLGASAEIEVTPYGEY